jgi:hypothetical protein
MTNPFKVARVEIPERIKAAVYLRAGGPGDVRCEGPCGGIRVKGRRFVMDHIKAEAKWPIGAERPPITADDVQLLGIDCGCAPDKDRQDNLDAKKSARILKKAAGLGKRRGRPMAGSRASGWKRKMDGTVEKR